MVQSQVAAGLIKNLRLPRPLRYFAMTCRVFFFRTDDHSSLKRACVSKEWNPGSASVIPSEVETVYVKV